MKGNIMKNTDLRKWRKQQCLTQSQAAEKLGVSVDAWRKWEQGVNKIPQLLDVAIRGMK
jgi:DNA-binding transcriptional regulator YiaG